MRSRCLCFRGPSCWPSSPADRAGFECFDRDLYTEAMFDAICFGLATRDFCVILRTLRLGLALCWWASIAPRELFLSLYQDGRKKIKWGTLADRLDNRVSKNRSCPKREDNRLGPDSRDINMLVIPRLAVVHRRIRPTCEAS
jgi:hypothetical protein